ncbi:MAG: YihY/virulence factor BrkB family protein [Candidatus Limnocylindrales bacterium]
MNPRAILARILQQPQVAAVRAPLDVYGRAAGGLLARGLAFSALFALLPTLLLVLGLVGWTAGDAASRDRISTTLISTFPPLASLIRDSVQAVSDGAALASIVGIVGVIWTVSQFYGALDQAIAHIYADVPERSAILRTARGVAMVVLLAGSVVGLIVIGSLALTLDALAAAQDPPMRAVVALLNSPLVMIVVASLVVLLVYRTVSPRTPGWHAAVIPAACVGAVLVVLSQAFVLLVPRLLGAQALAGSLASAFVTLAWLSLSFQALLLGAAWVRVRSESSTGARSTGSAALGRPAAPAESGVGRE